ncbi:hypothetical protein Ancab_007544 [Ancistrocladus abbreviatus]
MAMERRALALGLILMTFAGHCMGQLKVGFYDGKCNNIDIEDLIFRVVKAKYPKDIGSVGDLVRLSFHDCFVRGCDASILIDGKGTEKTALPNLTLDGFELIDAIKATVEKFCPGVVSCADVLVIATRVLVHLVSGHTVGVAHCGAFQDRLYNFQNTGKPDPSMSNNLLISLRKICPPSGNSTLTTFLDQTPGSGDVMDNAFYQAILKHNAVLRFDQLLATDPRTKDIVKTLATCPSSFSTKFGEAMVKMGRIGVLAHTQGEIRRSCRAVNKATRKLVEVDLGVDAD